MMRHLFLLPAFVAGLLVTASMAAEQKRVEKEKESANIILMRPKVVEGEVGKPAIIIIPRAALLDNDPFDKSYHNDIIRDLYLGTMRDLREIKR